MADFPNDPSSVTAEEMYPLCLLLVQYHGSDSNFPCKYSCILKLAVHILNKMLLLALGMQSLRYVQIICGTYANHSAACVILQEVGGGRKVPTHKKSFPPLTLLC